MSTSWMPVAVTILDTTFGADEPLLSRLLPAWGEIPDAFQNDMDPWCAVVHEWFFKGASADLFVPREGVEKRTALAHLAAIMRSFAPPHERKIAGVAYLCSLWFQPPGAR